MSEKELMNDGMEGTITVYDVSSKGLSTKTKLLLGGLGVGILICVGVKVRQVIKKRKENVIVEEQTEVHTKNSNKSEK